MPPRCGGKNFKTVMQKYALFIFIFIFRRETKKIKRLSKVNIGPRGDAKVFNFTMPN